MKKYIYIVIFISFGLNARAQTNIFDDTAEQQERTGVYAEESAREPDIAYGPGNPGEDPVPIDDYIPLLLVIAAGLIAYKTYGRKSMSS